MVTIRTTTDEKGKIAYNAKDICKAIGVSWRGKHSLTGLKPTHFSLTKAPVQLTDKVIASVKHYVMTEAGVGALCKLHDVDNPVQATTVKSTVETSSSKRIDELENTVKSLKLLVAEMIAKDQPAADNVDKTATEAKVTKKIMPHEARVEIRNLCVEYAKKLADNHGITATRDRGIFYDLTFNLLYTKYKQKTNIDIKSLAAQSSKTGLQIAQDYGIVVDLLAFAKETLV